MRVELENIRPMDIETRSFEIITRELGERRLDADKELIIKRCIHTSADFDYADNLCFSEGVVARALEAIKNGACIITDTQMAKAGINKKRLGEYGGQVYCFMSDEDVAEAARRKGTTRAAASMDKAAVLYQEVRGSLPGNVAGNEDAPGLIFAIGNAPTALVRLSELIREGRLKPELIIAVPVGFVNVVQSKEMILELENTPHIVAKGRKGGSNIAACICNALLYMM